MNVYMYVPWRMCLAHTVLSNDSYYHHYYGCCEWAHDKTTKYRQYKGLLFTNYVTLKISAIKWLWHCHLNNKDINIPSI